MPRRNRRREEVPEPVRRPRSEAPVDLLVPGHDVRSVRGEREYRCPWCDHAIRPGSQHIVVVPHDDVDARRHWHTECWRKELRRWRGRGG